MWTLKYDTNELIYETETYSETQRTDKGDEGGMNWESGVSRYKLLYIVWINNKVLWYSTRNSIQHPVINHNGKENEKENMFV